METNEQQIVPNPGEVWFVLLPEQVKVSEVFVLDTTAKTCLLRHKQLTYLEDRYEIRAVKWIEQSDRETLT